tara:strand:- start:888 stop:1046 length:159 start_codon:yes stop_codon:yes gene_type:complete
MGSVEARTGTRWVSVEYLHSFAVADAAVAVKMVMVVYKSDIELIRRDNGETH